MKIIYCIGSLAKAGGVERVLINKANYLSNIDGFQVTILIAKQNNLPYCYPVNPKVQVIDVNIEVGTSFFSRIPILGFWFNVWQLKKVYESIVNKIQPTIMINVERGYEDFIIPYLKSPRHTIRESHSSQMAVTLMDQGQRKWGWNHLKNQYFTYLYAKQLATYDSVILLTERDAQIRNLKNGKVAIPNIVTSFNCEPNYDVTSKKVISVGRLDRFKNFKDQILVWKEIIKEYPDWTLHIYGDGVEKEKLQQLIETLHLEKHVFLEGVAKNIQDYYSASSFFIFTSLAEGFGMVIVEAMQMGLPVVSYDCPCGPSDIIEDGVDGFLVPLLDRTVLKEKILELVETPNLRVQMSQNAIEKSKNYLPEKIMPHWINLFQKVIHDA